MCGNGTTKRDRREEATGTQYIHPIARFPSIIVIGGQSIILTTLTDGTEPDIVALNVFDNPMLVSEGPHLPPASLVVVELKRPMRNDAAQGEQKDPIEQALGYLDRIRQGKVQT